MRGLVAAGQMGPDTMAGVTYAHAIGNDPVFDSLLEILREPFAQHCGRKLLPTYAFGRIYQQGERLNKHRDRPACEYSLTMTLGFAGAEPWPIYTAIEPDGPASAWVIPPGRVLAYPGCETWHWREPLAMAWQAQMFFHYVDANGPHAHLKFDGRHGLAHQQCRGNCEQCPLRG